MPEVYNADGTLASDSTAISAGMFVYVKEKGWYPPFDFQLYYDKYDEDEIEDIYFSIENENRKVWLIPTWVRCNIHVDHFRAKNDTRGFYYENE